MGTFWATIGKIGPLFIKTSGHTDYYLDPPALPFGESFLRVIELILLKLRRNSLRDNFDSASVAPDASPRPIPRPGTRNRFISVSPMASAHEIRRSLSTIWLLQLSRPFLPRNVKTKKSLCGRHSSVVASAPAILWLWVWIPSTPFTLFFDLYRWNCNEKSTKMNKKSPGLASLGARTHDPVWPDWAIFKVLVTKFVEKVAQTFSNIFGLLWKMALFMLSCCKYFLGNFWWKLGYSLLQHLVTLNSSKVFLWLGIS